MTANAMTIFCMENTASNFQLIIEWIAKNWVEIIGTILGIAYIICSVKQKLVTWILGFASSVLYIYVFFTSKFYADMSLQLYYVYISIYGWISWRGGASKVKQAENEQLEVSHTNKKQVIRLTVVSAIIFTAIWLILRFLTDSPIPIGDALTTSLGIVATWMLAKKIIEHWFVWIFVDMLSTFLYLYKNLYATSFLYLIYTVAAIWGYFEWRKSFTNK